MENSKISKTPLAIVVFLLLGIVFLVGNHFISSATTYLSNETQQRSEYEQNMSHLQLKIAELERSIDALAVSKNTDGVEKYTLQLEEYCKQEKVKISKMSIGEPKKFNSICAEPLTVELSGGLFDILKCIKFLQQDGKAVSLKSISLRQDNDLLWLSRNVDGLKILPWIEFPSTFENRPDVGTGETEEPKPYDETPLLSKIFNHNEMLCYLEMEYIHYER